MKPLLTLALLGLAAGAAHAQADVTRLAQFDLGYARCEARFDHMRGHRDEAYLALWRVRLTPEQQAKLARQRKSAAYQQESGKAKKAMAKDSAALEETLRNQCHATWNEVLRNRPPGAAPQPSPAKK